MAKERVYTYRKNKPTKCWGECGVPIKRGDNVLSKQSNHWRIYHAECYERIYGVKVEVKVESTTNE